MFRREAAGLTMAAVAHGWGFTSVSPFSRVFRAAYGVSPAEWRSSAVRGPHASAPGSPPQLPHAR
ncbi:helix-turn-helix domain-containing protein [Streptomyces sp. NPDC056831]|uniref:helix-turn-helix domain-containing protein n=1 Tax=Streptomyces sp. NPDC056831 TaxID=3345954 RepID=UPI0036C8D111